MNLVVGACQGWEQSKRGFVPSQVTGRQSPVTGPLPCPTTRWYNPPVGNYRKLRVWQAAMELIVQSYALSRRLPKTERHAMSSQIQRAAVSVAANVAEGSGRKTDREFARFVRIAGGSANELETLFLAAQAIGYLDEEAVEQVGARIAAVRRQLTGLERRLLEQTTGDR